MLHHDYVHGSLAKRLILDIQQMLKDTREKQAAQKAQRQAMGNGQRSPSDNVQADRIAQLLAWAAFDDPILKAEALQQLSRLGLDGS